MKDNPMKKTIIVLILFALAVNVFAGVANLADKNKPNSKQVPPKINETTAAEQKRRAAASPPNYAASCPDPTSDPQGLQRFAANFLHTIKIKRYFTIYHYVGDKYGATGYLGTLPTDLKVQSGFDSPCDCYMYARY